MRVGNIIGGVPFSPKTVTFLTSSGQEIQAVLVDSEKVFTAEPRDVREGKTFASDYGVLVGTAKIIDHTHVYAHVDSNTSICLGIFAGSTELNLSDFVQIPAYDINYSGKYYINGTWYEDASGSIPWSSSLI